MSQDQPPVEQATRAPGEKRDVRRPPNLPAEPGETRPLPNKTDAAWEELEALREQARDLGIQVDERWSIARLQEEIAAVKGQP